MRKIPIPIKDAIISMENGLFCRNLTRLCVNKEMSSMTAGSGFTRMTRMVKGIDRLLHLFDFASMAMNANMIATRHRLIRYWSQVSRRVIGARVKTTDVKADSFFVRGITFLA